MRVAGVMLAGGQSSRMGRTKALVEIDGEAMGRRVLNALHAAGCDPVIVYGGDANELAPLGTHVEPDRFPGEGPVGAVAGVLELFSDSTAWPDAAGRPELQPADASARVVDGAVVVACDLPDLDAAVIHSLIDAAMQRPGAVVVARTERIEPLCGFWPVAVRARVEAAYESGVRAVHRVLDELDVVVVDVPDRTLRNINAPADLD